MRKTLAVASKELRQILRDRRSLMILLFVPAFFLLLFGYALNFDIRNVTLAVQDKDRSTKSRELVSSFVNSGYFSLVGYVDSPTELDRLVDEGSVRAILSIPPDFERDLAARNAGHRAGDHRRRQRQHRVDGDGLRADADRRVQHGANAGDPGARAPAPGLPVDHHRAAHLVQPAAAQHAVPGAGPDRLHLDDHRRRLDRALGRSRKGARHDGAGADGAAQSAAIHHRQDDAVPGDLVRVGDPRDRLSAMLLFDLPMRGSWLLLCLRDRLVPDRRAGAGAADLDDRAKRSRSRSRSRCCRRCCRR